MKNTSGYISSQNAPHLYSVWIKNIQQGAILLKKKSIRVNIIIKTNNNLNNDDDL